MRLKFVEECAKRGEKIKKKRIKLFLTHSYSSERHLMKKVL
jgi:hypothetical protein